GRQPVLDVAIEEHLVGTKEAAGVEVSSSDLDLIAAFRHTIYRQKIHGETEVLRRAVIERLLR
ncbi:hypothetical protein ACC740_37535, partial [Rhizobium ruizarguesonis]